jgi:predicted Zn-dependent protease
MRWPSMRMPGSKSRAILFLALLITAGTAGAQVRLPVLGDSLSGTISTQQEYEYGREFLRSARRQTPALGDPLIEEYVSNLTFKLAATSELTDHRLAFLMIDSEVLNAFAAPGGVVGVNAGLFLYAENEGEFASVLAHELAHISQRHYARTLEEQRNNRIPNMAGLLASLIIGAAAGGEAAQAAMMTTQAIGIDNQLRFSRNNEEEADRIGIRNLYNAGFDPNDMSGMFEHMLRESSFSQRPPEFMSTHPLDERRVSDARNRANALPAVDHVPNPEFLLMRERVLMHYARDFEAEIESRARKLPQLNGPEEDAARYGIALAQLKAGQYVLATESLDTLLRKEPARITYVMLEADIAIAAEDYPRALAILERNLKINPGNHPLTMNYASALTMAGRFQEAADVLEKHAIARPDDMQLWYDLAEVQGQAGNISKVHQARAEYFITVGDFARAREQLNFAQGLERDQLSLARIRARLDYIREIENKFYRQ